MKHYFIYVFFSISIIFFGCKKNNPSAIVVDEGIAPSEVGLLTTNKLFNYWDESITFFFDVNKGNSALVSTDGPLYLHIGLITSNSKDQYDWKEVATDWSKNEDAYKLTRQTDGRYSITINPSQVFKAINSSQVIKIALLLRNADGTKVQRNKDGSDMYVDIATKGETNIRFLKPYTQPTYLLKAEKDAYLINEELAIEVLSTVAGKLSMSIDEVEQESINGALHHTFKCKFATVGLHLITARIEVNGKKFVRQLQVFVNDKAEIAALPAGINKNGVTIDKQKKTVSFAVTAPGKSTIFLLGSFNNFQPESTYVLKQTPDGNTWWLTINDLDFSKKYAYQFLIDGQLRIADPYSNLVLDPLYDSSLGNSIADLPSYPIQQTTGQVSILELNRAEYPWKVEHFNKPNPYDLVIYELLTRDFSKPHNFNAIRDSIPYLKRLGINAVELMPVQESEGNSSWGYNPSYHLALDKYYGRADELKSLVDHLHQAGIAVILDVVLNHAFGQSPLAQLYFQGQTSNSNNIWFNRTPTHPFNVGYDFNHESSYTQTFVKDVLKYWIQEFKIDGFRFDLSKGFTQQNTGTSDSNVGSWSAYDASRVLIWKNYHDYLKTLDPSCYVILEHFGSDQEEQELAAEGMLLWNNLNGTFNEATMGYNNGSKSDLSRLFAESHGFQTPNMVTYMESHDEERIQFKNTQYGYVDGSYSVKDLTTALERTQVAATFLLASPGPKMIWQFGEFGYDVSIDENGRTGEKPLKWDYLANVSRKRLFDHYAKLIKLKRANPIFRKARLLSSSLQEGLKYYLMTDGHQTIFVVGNFDTMNRQFQITAGLAGNWYDNMAQSNLNWVQNDHIIIKPGNYYLLSKTKLIN
ncbi:alpha-amylase family glycosyl hydrolase [Sphingobacterium faecium]|jgi:1,4-alpha-glucan branching enzyme|uniref:alpha-amylase family glycosyl hydrolase n=1 Tax=Sphingobacterium faecium TaxID=34087 RepID=UPI0004E5EF55|nr:alpha-amylase family glycosyl hydrolase [Sphingobacterium faecium]CDS92940.1 1,4-alpha-glucan branching enzyme [Sphingobacterium sp. PM2-P1-29]SJN49828.1 Malto-oligosyltrehalose trehalohydrolase [Sphingobacterium faecium PCAi_F2.5]HCU44052.1 1,4-alpha-glucan-branching protein [Sphingobacterium sp.]UXD68450.1 alpha-amylase family glycosyl hydrolase [Sphingobacterium faecium]WGQ16155.1 alpha-amylase family glycosyl hydrolase [Sphingobacterium faecium]